MIEGEHVKMVPVVVSEELERERDEWKAKYINLKSQLTQTQGCVTISRNGYVQELERELATAHAEIKLLKTNLEISFRQTEQAVQDRAEEHKTITAQRDRLAEALRKCVLWAECMAMRCETDKDNINWSYLNDARETLAAVEGGNHE
jgi:hypothetical protein